jgi:hypothetical protein
MARKKNPVVEKLLVSLDVEITAVRKSLRILLGKPSHSPEGVERIRAAQKKRWELATRSQKSNREKT